MAWRQLQIDSEAGPQQVWIDEQTGQTTTTNPALAGAGLGYVNEMRQGPDGAMVDTQLVSTIGGIPADQFITRPRADGRLETYNPSTGQWEKTYRAPFDMAGGNQFLPESIAKPIGGSESFTNIPANNKGGFFEDYLFPAVVGGIATAGVGSMLGAGSLFGGAASGSGGLSGAGAADWMGSAFTPGAGTAAGVGATGGAMDTSWLDFLNQDAASSAGLNSAVDAGSGYTIDMSGRAIDAAGNVVNGTDGGISDFIKGAIQSGNLSELAKVLPSIPGGSTALKSLFGDSGGSSSGTGSSLWDILGRAAPGLLGAYAANQQTNAMTDLANKFSEYGAPSRARYEASMTPGFDPTSIPGYSGALDTASQSILRKLSATGGNPYGNPGGLIEANKQIVAGTALPAIQQYQNQNANTGGLGALAAAYPSTQQAATQSGANVYNALGNAAGEVFNPKQTPAQSLADIYKLINSGMKAA